MNPAAAIRYIVILLLLGAGLFLLRWALKRAAAIRKERRRHAAHSRLAKQLYLEAQERKRAKPKLIEMTRREREDLDKIPF